jgi:uncharacterized membrane protein YraQ (UPF0718 family)
MKKFLSKFGFLIVTLAVFIAVLVMDRDSGISAIGNTFLSIKEMAFVLPPIFILIGLLDMWVPRETMARYMGEGSGVRGAVISFMIGAAAAGPLYAAFPIAGIFMKKDVSFFNILVFIGGWSTTKIPMFLFEITSLGAVFAVTRLLLNIPIILCVAWVISKILKPEEKREIYQKNYSV